MAGHYAASPGNGQSSHRIHGRHAGRRPGTDSANRAGTNRVPAPTDHRQRHPNGCVDRRPVSESCCGSPPTRFEAGCGPGLGIHLTQQIRHELPTGAVDDHHPAGRSGIVCRSDDADHLRTGCSSQGGLHRSGFRHIPRPSTRRTWRHCGRGRTCCLCHRRTGGRLDRWWREVV